GVDEQCRDVGIGRTRQRRTYHRPVEPSAWGEDPGRVNEGDLRLAGNRNPAHDAARGLHLRAYDRNLRADQRIQERRFAGVGGSDQRDEAEALRSTHAAVRPAHLAPLSSLMPCAASAASAAARWASRLVAPTPSPETIPCTSTAIRNSGR